MTKLRDPDVAVFLPLNPVVFRILMVLTEGERHGYSIVKEVEKESKLLAEGIIEESARRPDPSDDDARRRYFRLSALGRRVVRAEAARLDELVRDARARDLLPEPGTAEGLTG